MTGSPRSQEDHQTSNILGPAQSAIGRELLQMLHTALGIDETSRHLGRIEAGSDGVGENVPGTQLNSQVLGQMNGSGL